MKQYVSNVSNDSLSVGAAYDGVERNQTLLSCTVCEERMDCIHVVQKPCEYLTWLSELMQAHSAMREYEQLPKSLEAVARDAFRCCPNAVHHAPLLRAFYSDRRCVSDSSGNKFRKPHRAKDFFLSLGDVIYQAQLWDRETGWTRKQQKKKAKALDDALVAQKGNDEYASEEEKMAFFAELRDIVEYVD